MELETEHGIFTENTVTRQTAEEVYSEWLENKEYFIVNALNNAKQEKIILSKIELSTYLTNNPLLFSDGKYYSITQEKQNLLNNAIAIYQLKAQVGLTDIELKWNSTGDECAVWTIENLSMLALSIASYVEPLISHQQSLELKIKNCTTKIELDAVVIDYETIT